MKPQFLATTVPRTPLDCREAGRLRETVHKPMRRSVNLTLILEKGILLLGNFGQLMR